MTRAASSLNRARNARTGTLAPSSFTSFAQLALLGLLACGRGSAGGAGDAAVGGGRGGTDGALGGPSGSAAGTGGASTAGTGDGSTGGASRAGAGTDGGVDGGGTGGAGAAPGNGGVGGRGGSAGAADGAAGAGGTVGAMNAARAFTTKLGRPANFLIGIGNDLAGAAENYDHNKDGAFTLGTTLDLHYVYLVGLQGMGGWPDWNSGGTFVNIIADSSAAHGTVPMFTLYAFAAQGENRTDVLTNADFMRRWWAGARLLFDRLAIFNKPAVVHVEPDFWGFMQRATNGDPTRQRALVTMVTDCTDLPDTVAGIGQCIVRLGRKYAPKVALGFHASAWGGAPTAIVTFLNAIGAQASDFVGVDPLDRDAGCFEAHVDPNCQRNDGPWYWDEANVAHPNFHDHFTATKIIADGIGKPVLWWQVPFGVPSTTPGGAPGRYRDNRVHYLFTHVNEFITAGIVGAAFGTGAGNQTYITSDGGQFKTAVAGYFAKPVPLP